MKIIPILILAYLGYALSDDPIESSNKRRLQNIVNKYRHLSTGNAEFSRWIEKIYYAIDSPVFNPGNVVRKIELLNEFNIYDRRRQELEDSINNRLSRVRKLLNLKMGGKGCVKFYKMQANELKNALKLTNNMKEIKVDKNSRSCPQNLSEKEDSDDSDYL
ncbi:uncharacterized protein LOC119547224 [Drosophila subpulchrella]|uniref:uncharacterized protein LOC119547224 n=1 Tax=Drosophila subpulchrella TaxID=1486046 RepID=UPI0018A13396|nr:uncharacterized protein LOC119547224 [Drosophila subpulchrella]